MASNTLVVELYDGTGAPLPDAHQVLLMVTDGNQKQIVRQYFQGGRIELKGLPFYDNFGDNYTVIASVDGYKQSGYTALKLSPEAPVTVALMMVPKEAAFNFSGLNWEATKRKIPFFLEGLGEQEQEAQVRYSELMESNSSKSFACMLNLVTAMETIDLGGRSPNSFIQQIRWDQKAPAQDRFFAYCERGLIDAVSVAADRGKFDPEHGCGLMHPGASLSWKQNEYPTANVQLTFHTEPGDCLADKDWVTVEVDIDYYKDLATHAILEVARNKLTGSLTEPADVFVFRWVEQRRLQKPDFNPGYTLRKG